MRARGTPPLGRAELRVREMEQEVGGASEFFGRRSRAHPRRRPCTAGCSPGKRLGGKRTCAVMSLKFCVVPGSGSSSGSSLPSGRGRTSGSPPRTVPILPRRALLADQLDQFRRPSARGAGRRERPRRVSNCRRDGGSRRALPDRGDLGVSPAPSTRLERAPVELRRPRRWPTSSARGGRPQPSTSTSHGAAGAVEVQRQELDRSRLAVDARRPRDPAVELAAPTVRQSFVRGVADQRMPEPEPARDVRVALDELGRGGPTPPSRPPPRDRPRAPSAITAPGEETPSTDAQRRSARSPGAEPVDPRRDERLDRLGQLLGLWSAVLGGGELLQEERVPGPALGDRRELLVVSRRSAAAATSVVASSAGSGSSRRVSAGSGGVPPRPRSRRPPGRRVVQVSQGWSGAACRGDGGARTRRRPSSGRPRRRAASASRAAPSS